MLPREDTENVGAHSSLLITRLWDIIRFCIKLLAILMTLVIIWGLFDVVWVLVERMKTPPLFLLNINDILATFGAFMAVLIAVEIFANIIVYLESEMIHLKLVMSTALMAAARKVIVLDYSVIDYLEVFALGAVIIALSAGYWLICHPNAECSLHGPLHKGVPEGGGCVRPESPPARADASCVDDEATKQGDGGSGGEA